MSWRGFCLKYAYCETTDLQGCQGSLKFSAESSNSFISFMFTSLSKESHVATNYFLSYV